MVYLTFQGYYWLLNKRAKGKLEEKPVLVEHGYQFRDLNGNGKLDIYEDSRQAVEARVDNLLEQMTLKEKVGMFWHPPIGIGNRGQVLGKPAMMSPESSYDVIINQKVRHFNLFQVPKPKFMARWNNRIQKIAEMDRLGIPITISSDPRNGLKNFLGENLLEGGYSKWPEPIGLAAIGDSSLAYRFGQIAGHEMRSVGIRTALHPMADLATEPRWTRVNGTFGENAKLSAAMTSAYIMGFQGSELGSSSVACMTKHWPGGGPQANGEDAHFSYGKEQVYPGDNFKYHLLPFKAAIAAGTAMMMPYYSIPKDQTSQDVAMAFNKEIITDMLRNEHGYDGVVCSDWGILEGFSLAGIELVEAKDWGVENLSIEDKIVMAIDAGVDQFGGNNNGKQLLAAVENGKIVETRLDKSVSRLLKVKFEIGLFDNPYVDEKNADQVVGAKPYMLEGAEAQRKAMVLLKNSIVQDGSLMPLKDDLKLFVEKIDPEIASKYARIVEDSDQADVALIRLETPWDARSDDFAEKFFHQGSLEFDPQEVNRLVAIAENTPTIFFIYLDRAAVIPEISSASAGLVAEFGATDDAVLDIAFGRSKPMGRLPIELPSSMEAVKAQLEDVPYDSNEPLYPFGYGLRY